MRVGQLARKLGITPETVRFYTRIGYLNPSVDKSNGYKNYKEPEVQRIKRTWKEDRKLKNKFDASAILIIDAEKKRIKLHKNDRGRVRGFWIKKLPPKHLRQDYYQLAAIEFKLPMISYNFICDKLYSVKKNPDGPGYLFLFYRGNSFTCIKWWQFWRK